MPISRSVQFQSHQIFHVFVVAAACVHYYGICVLAHHQSNIGDCPKHIVPTVGSGAIDSIFT